MSADIEMSVTKNTKIKGQIKYIGELRDGRAYPSHYIINE